MHLAFEDRYPTGAVGGADFFTLAAQGDVIMEGPDGPEQRRERILITDRWLEGDAFGQVCVGERTVRHLAHALHMVDDWRVARVVDDNRDLRLELVELSERVARAEADLRLAREVEAGPATKVYLAFDGSEHASRRAAIESSAKSAGLETRALLAAQRQVAKSEASA